MRTTPATMTVRQAARGWRVSVQHAYRIVHKREAETGRKLLRDGKIRTAEFLAIPRGEEEAPPMIPEVDEIRAELAELHEFCERLATRLAQHERAGHGVTRN